MPGQHAVLSPSSATRWINCPASVRMSQLVKREEETESFYAREGTAAHALAEIMASLHFGMLSADEADAAVASWEREFADILASADGVQLEMQGHAESYVALLQHFVSQTPHAQVMLEQRLPTGVPESWGTSDTVIVSPEVVHIVDLKYGKGVQVSPVGNPQLRLYGLGALDTYGDMLGDTEAVRMTIFQPRLGYTETAEMTPAELRAWRERVALPAARLALSDAAPFGPGEAQCRFCPVAGSCKPRMEYMVAIDFADDPDLLTDEEIGELVPRLKDIKRWTDEVEKEALARAYTEGREIPGHKVVLRGGRRIITDQAHAIQVLIDAGYTAEQVADFKTKSLSSLEKLVGSRDALEQQLGKLLRRTEGKPAIVSNDDPGVPVTAVSQAVSEFTDIPD